MTNAGSISVLLTQGLHTKDTKLLDEVISKQYHVNVIKNTLKRMSASDAVKLLVLVSFLTNIICDSQLLSMVDI